MRIWSSPLFTRTRYSQRFLSYELKWKMDAVVIATKKVRILSLHNPTMCCELLDLYFRPPVLSPPGWWYFLLTRQNKSHNCSKMHASSVKQKGCFVDLSGVVKAGKGSCYEDDTLVITLWYYLVLYRQRMAKHRFQIIQITKSIICGTKIGLEVKRMFMIKLIR